MSQHRSSDTVIFIYTVYRIRTSSASSNTQICREFSLCTRKENSCKIHRKTVIALELSVLCVCVVLYGCVCFGIGSSGRFVCSVVFCIRCETVGVCIYARVFSDLFVCRLFFSSLFCSFSFSFFFKRKCAHCTESRKFGHRLIVLVPPTEE